MPTVRAEGETIDTKPLRSEIEVEPIRAEMQVLPMRRDTFDNPDDEERRDIEVILSSVRITGLAFSVGAVLVGRPRGRPDGEPARLLARVAPRRPAAGARPRRRGGGDVGRERRGRDKDRKDDEHRAAWVLEERGAS